MRCEKCSGTGRNRTHSRDCEYCAGTGRCGAKSTGQDCPVLADSGKDCSACKGMGTVPNPPEEHWAEFRDGAAMSATALPTRRGPKWARPVGGRPDETV